MSEATVKTLTDVIYDAYQDSNLLHELDNEQVYEVARLAAWTIEAAGTTTAIIRAHFNQYELGTGEYVESLANYAPLGSYRYNYVLKLAQAIREVSS